MKKILVLLPWVEFLDVHLVKDVGLFPLYFKTEYKIPVDFVFLDNKKTGTKLNEYEGMNLIKLSSKTEYKNAPRIGRNPFKFFKFTKIFKDFLSENKNSYSHVMMFHVSTTTLHFVRFIKKLNKDIKIYIKSDAATFKNKQWIYLKQILKLCDALSVENDVLFDQIKNKFSKCAKKIAYIPNGFDDKALNAELFSVPKENIIIQTARFGTPQKNTQLLLKILSEIDLKNWQVILAGTIEKDFESYIADYFKNHPELKDKIHFIGNVSDRNELYSLYAKAKIFILTSRWESFALSLMEASFFADYIISTNVGIAPTIKNKFCGFVAEGNPLNAKNDEKIALEIEQELKRCIENPENCIISENVKEKIRQEFSMSNIVKNEIFKGLF